MSTARIRYAGIATRALALALDVAIVQVIVFTGAAVFALVASLVGGVQMDTVARVLAAAAWAATAGGYFVLFWSTTGQTPAMRVMDITVSAEDGTPPSLWRSIVRLIGLVLAIIPLFAGFLPVLVDNRRRGIHDMLADTVVVHGHDQWTSDFTAITSTPTSPTAAASSAARPRGAPPSRPAQYP